MNKVKKVLTSIGVFISGIVSKVYATTFGEPTFREPEIISMYAVDPGPLDSISRVGKIAIPVVLFVIGLFVVLSKKITKKVKAIVISVLVLLGILGYIFMNYIATNF